MVFITGDKHGDFGFLEDFCKEHPNTSINDTLIILGDAGINFFLNREDRKLKKYISKFPITLLCVHGNHEERPYRVKGYKLIDRFNGQVYQEAKYPNILFAKDGENYTIDNHKFFILGGAYSTDKYMRLEEGWPWFQSEQPSPDIKMHVEETLMRNDNKFDIVLSHTCPYSFIKEFNLHHSYVDPNHEIDYSTELWLEQIRKRITFNRWYFGHFHLDKMYKKGVAQIYNKIFGEYYE